MSIKIKKLQWQSRAPNTSSPELLGSGKGTKRRPYRESAPLRTTWVPEPERLGPGKCRQPRPSHRWFPAEQPRAWAAWAGRLHAPWTGARPSVAETLRAHASIICLQHPSLPPHSAAEQVSLKKKKKCPPPSPLCQGGNQTLKRPANRRSYNRGNRLGSYRQ